MEKIFGFLRKNAMVLFTWVCLIGIICRVFLPNHQYMDNMIFFFEILVWYSFGMLVLMIIGFSNAKHVDQVSSAANLVMSQETQWGVFTNYFTTILYGVAFFSSMMLKDISLVISLGGTLVFRESFKTVVKQYVRKNKDAVNSFILSRKDAREEEARRKAELEEAKKPKIKKKEDVINERLSSIK